MEEAEATPESKKKKIKFYEKNQERKALSILMKSITDKIGLFYVQCKCIATDFTIEIHWKSRRKGLSVVRN